MQVYNSLTDVMGNTPLIRLKSVVADVARTANVLVKVEYLNPGGSIKDRIALRMVETAEKYGTPGNLVNGANIGGFLKVANAMLDQGLV